MSSLLDNPPALVEHFHVSRERVTSIAFNPLDDRQFAISCNDGIVTTFHIPQKNGRIMKFDRKVLGEIYAMDWSRKNMIAAVGKEKLACIFECSQMRGYNENFIAHQKSINSVQFSYSANRIVTASNDKTVKMWRLSEKRPEAVYTGHTNWVRCARLSPDNKLVGSCADDRILRIFDAKTSELVTEFKDMKGFGNQCAWHKDSNLIAIAQENNRVKLYDLRAKKLIQYYRVFEDSVTSLDFHSSGNFVITGCKDGTVKILDLLEGRDIYTLCGHHGSVTSVKFSYDGDHFVTGSEDRHIMVWKSNLVSLANDEDQENEDSKQNPIKQEVKEEKDDPKRQSIMIDAKKSSNYNLEK